MVMRQCEFREQQHFEKDYIWRQERHIALKGKLEEKLTERHKATVIRGLIEHSLHTSFDGYTLGKPVEEIRLAFEQVIDDVVLYIEETNSDLTNMNGLEWYISCLWYLSFCYFFDVPQEKVQLIADNISLKGKDWLIDRLIAASIPDQPIAIGKLAFPEVYKPLAEALSYDQTTEERTAKIQLFLKNYYPLLKKYDVTWHDSHKEPDPEYCFHFGYWIFELGALAADIGWDDTSFRDHPMYPKDLVDWKFAQRPKDEQIKI
jgi:hypothetical protein